MQRSGVHRSPGETHAGGRRSSSSSSLWLTWASETSSWAEPHEETRARTLTWSSSGSGSWGALTASSPSMDATFFGPGRGSPALTYPTVSLRVVVLVSPSGPCFCSPRLSACVLRPVFLLLRQPPTCGFCLDLPAPVTARSRIAPILLTSQRPACIIRSPPSAKRPRRTTAPCLWTEFSRAIPQRCAVFLHVSASTCGRSATRPLLAPTASTGLAPFS